MKVGILTYHRAENYGALLQAYATKTYLQSLGHDVSFVDYWPKYHSDYFKLFPWQQINGRSLFNKIIFFIILLWGVVPRFIRKRRLQRFMYERLELSKYPKYQDNRCRTGRFDIVIYGSDQIWRKQNLGSVGFDNWYFGSDYVLADKKVVYAGSMGMINTTVSDDEYIKKMMRSFNHISVREKDLQVYLSKLCIESVLVCDPVFLLTKEQWRMIKYKSQSKWKYILFYNLLNTPESKYFADSLRDKTGLPVREINKQASPRRIGERYIRSASVEQFLQLIDDAEYVVSNSFHGIAMSIIFQKQFYAVGMGSKSNRVLSLLDMIGLSDRYSHDGSLKIVNESSINYEDVMEQLDLNINCSKDYLNISICE